jgi:uncharacterized protein YkwD
MNGHRSNIFIGLSIAILLVSTPAHARDLAGLLEQMRASDCARSPHANNTWYANSQLDDAARRWARTHSTISDAVQRSGYLAAGVSGLHFYGLDAPGRAHLTSSSCRLLQDQTLQDIGEFRRDQDIWIVFATPVFERRSGDMASLERDALALVNRARAVGRRCGPQQFPHAPPLTLAAVLTRAAAGHAQDMAVRHYFEHRDPDGRTPADRVQAAGYQSQRVGENIAFGSLTVKAAIDGWLASPGHCANLMDLRFTEMGIAFAQGRGKANGIYWVQLFAEPR